MNRKIGKENIYMNQKNLGNENLRGFEKLKKKQKKNNKKRD
jgi:hypothetical protein